MCDHMSQKVSDKRHGRACVNTGNVFLNASQAPLRQARRTLLLPLVESSSGSRDTQSVEVWWGNLTTPQQPTVNSVIKMDYC